MAPWHGWVAFSLLAMMLALATGFDLRRGRIPNALTYPAALAGLALAGTAGGWHGGAGGVLEGLQAGFVAMLAGFVPFALVFAMGGLGGGDVKLMAALGAISASWQCVLGTAVYGLLVGLLMAVAIMIRRRIVARTLLRLLGAAVSISAGARAQVSAADSPRIPFAMAIGVGGLVAGMEHLLDVPMPWSPWFS